MAMMISWVMPVNPSHPYLENDPAPSFAPTICAFHLGFSLGSSIHLRFSSRQGLCPCQCALTNSAPQREHDLETVPPLTPPYFGRQ